MPYRPLRDDEKAEIQKAIDSVKRRLEMDRQYLTDLEKNLTEGQWYSDLAKPKK